MKSRCPLLARHVYGLNDQHHVPNIPCDRADQEIFLFPHLTYFHKLNGKAATKLIRALLIQKNPLEPIFHPNETIIVSHPNLPPQSHKMKRSKTTNDKRKNNEIIDLSRSSVLLQYQNLLNALQNSINEQNSHEGQSSSPSSSFPLGNERICLVIDPNSMPLDFTRVKT